LINTLLKDLSGLNTANPPDITSSFDINRDIETSEK
jgi:hypothetical protein